MRSGLITNADSRERNPMSAVYTMRCRYAVEDAEQTYAEYPKTGFHFNRCFISKMLANTEDMYRYIIIDIQKNHMTR